jgi:hypothetical protein
VNLLRQDLLPGEQLRVGQDLAGFLGERSFDKEPKGKAGEKMGVLQLVDAAAGKGEAIDLRLGLLGADTKEVGQPPFFFAIDLFLQLKRKGGEVSLVVGDLYDNAAGGLGKDIGGEGAFNR